jgi:hypothetical protein
MMDAIAEQSAAQAWCVSFEPTPPNDQFPLLVIEQPHCLFAVARPLAVVDALMERAVVQHGASVRSSWRRTGAVPQRSELRKSLILIWVPADVAIPRDLEQRLETWLLEGLGSKRSVIRSGLRTSRIIWTDDRAVIHTSAEQVMDVRDAVIRFTIASRETLILEQQMAENWPTIDARTSRSHNVPLRGQTRQADVKQVTEQVSHMRATLLRLETALEQLDPALSSTSKRLYAELSEQARLHDRLEVLEDPIEFAVDHYELANSRLIEAKNAAREYFVGSLIAVLLAAELITSLAPHLFASGLTRNTEWGGSPFASALSNERPALEGEYAAAAPRPLAPPAAQSSPQLVAQPHPETKDIAPVTTAPGPRPSRTTHRRKTSDSQGATPVAYAPDGTRRAIAVRPISVQDVYYYSHLPRSP